MSTISHTRAITSIKDPIHGTINSTIFEREVLDSKLFQHLHFILQNSMSYSAFPNNKVSRFIHSLGVCHLSGRMLTNALADSSSNDLLAMLKDTATIINNNYVVPSTKANDNRVSAYITGWQESIAGRSDFTHHPMIKSCTDTILGYADINSDPALEDVRAYPALFLIDTLWQVTRLAGLLHDKEVDVLFVQRKKGVKLRKELKEAKKK